MKKIFTTLFLFCFMFSYVFCVPSLAYTYQAQPIVLNDNIIALNETNQTATNSSPQLYQNINGVFVPVTTTQTAPTTQYQQPTPVQAVQYQQTTTTTPVVQYQPAPVVVQPAPQPTYTQITTVTETIIEEKPSLGARIAAGVFGTILVGGLIALAAISDDEPRHHDGHKKGHSGGHKPSHRR